MNITPSLLKKWVDIRNNSGHWNQKFSLIEFHDEKKRPWWTKEYKTIPHWRRYKKSTEWIKNTDFPEYNCKIGWNANNEILLVTQNYFGSQRLVREKRQEILGKIKKKIHQEINNMDNREYQAELKEGLKCRTIEDFYNFPHTNLFSEELEQLENIQEDSEAGNQAYDLSRNDLVLLWKKQIYFITSFTYTDNYKLTVEIRAKKCQLTLSYYNWIKSWGTGIVNQAPNLIKDTENRLHYDFCGDLGIKRIEQQAFNSYQPQFHLFRIRPTTPSGGRYIGWANKSERGLKIPYNVALEPFDENKETEERALWEQNQVVLRGLMAISAITGAEEPIRRAIQALLKTNLILMIGPEEMVNTNKSYFNTFKNCEEELFPNNPTFTKWLKEQPHLWDHTTFQFYLFNKITMTANGRYLGVKERDGKFFLPYKLFINCSPGALYYCWQFEFIFVKLEISTQGNFQDYTNPMRFMQGFNFKIEGGILGSGGGFGLGMNWNSSNADQAGRSEANEDPKAEQEAQTERMYKNTFRSFLDKPVEPAMFNANTIDFNYSLGEFYNRLTTPIFFYRCEISELLKNRLDWANNKSHMLNLPLSWRELGTWTQKPGLWKWSNVYLEKDKDNFWTNIMNRGYFLDNDEELENPRLAFAHASSHIQVGSNAWNINQAEEEVTETREEIRETLLTADMTTADYGIVDYIGSPDANIWAAMEHRVHPESWGTGGRDCLGCLCGGGSHDNPSYSFSRTYNFTSGGTLHLKTRGSGPQTCTIPAQGGTVVFEALGNSGTITLIREEIRREVRLIRDPNPIQQEIDQEVLENEVEEEIVEEIEGENEEEMTQAIRDSNTARELEVENEPEQEQERENEQEAEKEQEQEQETEKENERETEQEKEEEKEQEIEEIQEQTQEQEQEYEGEEEELEEL